METFYNEIKELLVYIECNETTIIMVDVNARIDNVEVDEIVGLEEHNYSRGERLLQF